MTPLRVFQPWPLTELTDALQMAPRPVQKEVWHHQERYGLVRV